jgi:baseplate J-like protein
MTSKRAIIPTSASIIAPAIAKLIEHRPRAFASVNLGQGRYAYVFEGLRAQAELAIARLADGAIGNTLNLAKGEQLKSFVASEYELPTEIGPTKAIGSLVLDRTSSIEPKLAGVIRKGKKFRRNPDPNGIVPLEASEYSVSSDTFIDENQNTVEVPLEAVREGASANTPYVLNAGYAPVVSADGLFDKNLIVTTYDMGGGSDGFSDSDVLRYALAYALGEYGPTDDALILAALRAGGVRRIIIDGSTVYVTDPSWASSSRWCDAVKQSMSDSDVLSYATRFTVAPIPSYPVIVQLTVRLRDNSFLSNTATIDESITKTVRSYFDDRDDFNVIATTPLRSSVTRADRRILRCTAASILNMNGSPFVSSQLSHAYLAHSAVQITYLPPI